LIAFSKTGGAPAAVTLERIINESDLTAIEFFVVGLAVARAVCRIVIRDNANRVAGYGTGFRIGPELIMTNNHVLETADIASASLAEFDYVRAFGGRQLAVIPVALDPRRFFITHPRLDFTIVALAAPERVLSGRSWLPLKRESGKAIKREAVNILQHPSGDPLSIAFRNNLIVDVLPDFLHYGTDTMPGSSGSPVTNDAWDLAALHHSGVPAIDRRTGDLLKMDGTVFRSGDDPALIKWVANEGVRISRIVAHLDGLGFSGVKAELYASAFMTPTTDLVFKAWGNESALSPQGPTVPSGFGQSEDGRARWFFEIAFGPVSGTGSPNAAAGMNLPVPAVRPAIDAFSQPRLQVPAATSQIREAARRLFERARDRCYFDAGRTSRNVEAYYRNVGDLDGAQLEAALRELLRSTHKQISNYSKARLIHLYPWVDRYPDLKLRSVYSGKIMDAEEIVVDELQRLGRANPNFVESLERGGIEAISDDLFATAQEALERLEAEAGFNCEHVVPQSWFGKREPMRSDLHHLFTCESDCNSFRGNIPYFDFKDFEPQPAPDPAEAAARRLCGKRDVERGRQGFEPEFNKGAVARATLYFLLRYPGEIGDRPVEFNPDDVGLLIDWHNGNPVSDWERHRNEAIAEVQQNRNPFIDNPSWAEKVFRTGPR
jgi:endonuclease G